MDRLDTAGADGGEVRPISKLNSICGMAGSAIVAVLLVSWEMHGGSNSWDPTAV